MNRQRVGRLEPALLERVETDDVGRRHRVGRGTMPATVFLIGLSFWNSSVTGLPTCRSLSSADVRRPRGCRPDGKRCLPGGDVDVERLGELVRVGRAEELRRAVDLGLGLPELGDRRRPRRSAGSRWRWPARTASGSRCRPRAGSRRQLVMTWSKLAFIEAPRIDIIATRVSPIISALAVAAVRRGLRSEFSRGQHADRPEDAAVDARRDRGSRDRR